MTDTSFLKDLSEAWQQRGYSHAVPATREQIQSFEFKHNVKLPQDLRAYFETLNGGDIGHEGSMDDEAISFWRLDQLEALDEMTVGRSNVFAFGDFLIDSHLYAIQLSSHAADPTPVFIDWAGNVEQVASSFAEFVRGYVAKDRAILFGARPAA